MLSYQHIYHAGNPADVHKHIALVLLLRQLQQKATPICFVDAHAGSGVYDLTSAEAQQTREAERGILRLTADAAGAADEGNAPDEARASDEARAADAADAAGASAGVGAVGGANVVDAAVTPAAVRDYIGLVRQFNPTGPVCRYPGSAALAQSLLRDDDRAILLERHPAEVATLKRTMAADRRVAVHARDSYEGLPALLPPPIRRGLVLIDPSYEIKTEYDTVARLLHQSLQRWATGVYLLWYPLLGEERHRHLIRRLTELKLPKLQRSEFHFATAGPGLRGSGLFVVNAPWKFAEEFSAAMRFVAAMLEPGGKRRHDLTEEAAT